MCYDIDSTSILKHSMFFVYFVIFIGVGFFIPRAQLHVQEDGLLALPRIIIQTFGGYQVEAPFELQTISAQNYFKLFINHIVK